MIESSLVGVIALSALLFGAVERWSIAVISVATALIFVFCVLRVKSDDLGFEGARGLLFSMLVLLLYPLFQLIPLPVSLIALVHHGLKDLLTLSPSTVPVYHSIAVYPYATEASWTNLAVCLMMFSAAAFGFRGEDRLFRAMKLLIVFGFMLGIFGLIQQATWNGKLYWFRERPLGGVPFGPFVNRNHFAGFVGMIIPLSLGATFTARTLEKRVLFGFLGVMMTVSLFFSLSRGGITAFFAGILIFSLIVFLKERSSRRLIPVFLFVIVVAAYLLYLGIAPIVARFSQAEVSHELRLAAWKGTLAAFRDFPVFGSGLGTFRHIFKIYQPEGLYLYWDHAHNDYLEALLEVGVIGSLIALVFFVAVFRVILSREWDDEETYMGAALVASITTIAVHSIFDFNLHILSNEILFSFILGMAVNMGRAKSSPPVFR